MKEGAHQNLEAPQYLLLYGRQFAEIGELIEKNSGASKSNIIRAIRGARRPPLRTTHFALRIQNKERYS